jgi:signal transduction histidine kinase
MAPDALGPGSCGVRFGVFTTGEPIAPDEGERLFEAGVRGQAAAEEEGTGHGLFFVRQIIELHGGRVGVDPRPDGNEFYITLPCDPPQGGDAATQGGDRP